MATKPKAPAAKKTAKPTKPARPAPVVKNGITQPREGGKTRIVWDKCSELAKSLKRTPTRQEVIAAQPKLNADTVATQYGYWRRFEGITGRIVTPKPAAPKKPAAPGKAKPAAPKKPAAPAKPAAPKPAAPAAPVAPAAPQA